MFAYCNNNPIMYSDPDGMTPILTLYMKFYSFISDFMFFSRAYKYCENYLDTTLYLPNTSLQIIRFNKVVSKNDNRIAMEYVSSPGNRRTYLEFDLIEKRVSEWYKQIYTTFREKYILLNYIDAYLTEYEEYIDLINQIEEISNPDALGVSADDVLALIIEVLDFYDWIRAETTEDDFLYPIVFSKWERYVLLELKKYKNPESNNARLMLNYSITTSIYNKKLFSKNYVLISSVEEQPWEVYV